jgi:hypothetical protein
MQLDENLAYKHNQKLIFAVLIYNQEVTKISVFTLFNQNE